MLFPYNFESNLIYMIKVKTLLESNFLYLIGAFIGAISGFLYWKYVGCQTGTCSITSSSINSTIYFALMGTLVFGLFKKEKKHVK
jgi:hypothetical protein